MIWQHVLLYSSLLLFVVSWLFGWIATSRAITPAIKLWQLGWLLYLGSFVAMFRPFELGLANYALAISTSSVTLALLVQALLHERYDEPRWGLKHGLAAVGVFWLVLITLIVLRWDFSRVHFLVYGLVEIYAVRVCVGIGQRWRSRSMYIVALGVTMFVVNNLLRFVVPQQFVLDNLGSTLDGFSVFCLIMLNCAPVTMMSGFAAHLLDRATQEKADIRLQAHTERLLLEQTRAHAERMDTLLQERNQMLITASRLNSVSSMGMLTSALVHELGQPVQAIELYAQMVKSSLEQVQGVSHDMLNELTAAAHRTSSTLNNLRRMIVNNDLRCEPVALDASLQVVEQIAQSALQKSGVALVLDAPQAVKVWADAIMLERILLNLVTNAMQSLVQASTQAPRIHLSVRVDVEQSSDNKGGWVTLSVSDNGPGFAPEILGLVQEPFFTTKSEGLGLGLALARSAIEQWGGVFEIVNQAPRGGCVQIRLKATQGVRSVPLKAEQGK